MKEQGILFKAEMVRAILNTRIGDDPGPIDPTKPWKCVTRRLIKHQPFPAVGPRIEDGQNLWVRETFADNAQAGINPTDSEWVYKATDPDWEITVQDAVREGVEHVRYAIHPVKLYRDLWEKINGPGSWDQNPWVWRIEFRRK